MTKVLARWESRSRKHWVILEYTETGAGIYRSNDAGGCLGRMGEAEALIAMQAKVDSGYFLPDAAKTPMHRVV